MPHLSSILYGWLCTLPWEEAGPHHMPVLNGSHPNHRSASPRSPQASVWGSILTSSIALWRRGQNFQGAVIPHHDLGMCPLQHAAISRLPPCWFASANAHPLRLRATLSRWHCPPPRIENVECSEFTSKTSETILDEFGR